MTSTPQTKILLSQPQRKPAQKLNSKVNFIPPDKSSNQLFQPRQRKSKVYNQTSTILMPRDQRRIQFSNKKSPSTKKLLLSSLKSVESSLKTYNPKVVKPSSSKKERSAQRLSLPKLPPSSSRSIYSLPQRRLPRTSTENLMPRSSRSSQPSQQRPTNLPIPVQFPSTIIIIILQHC